MQRMISPNWIGVVAGKMIYSVHYLNVFETVLPTEVAEFEGLSYESTRSTIVNILDNGGIPYIYELGQPICPSYFPWSVDIRQRVLATSTRDELTPEYRKALTIAILNEMHHEVHRMTNSLILQEALANPGLGEAAVNSIVTQHHGEQRVLFDPYDQEANNRAAACGYTIVRAGAYTPEQWTNIARAKAIVRSSELFPTEPSYIEGETPHVILEGSWTCGMAQVVAFSKEAGRKLLGKEVQLTLEDEPQKSYVANYTPSSGHLVLNVPRLGRQWFDMIGNLQNIVDLLIHEFAHEYSINHLSTVYYDALTRLGGQFTYWALVEPEMFQKYMK